ncbi:alpha-amylase/4-alpha-glucanotransferase domain-containing protein [Candidatus Palauibacter sp.]|uniref:alpha-amylase/4-alpha-glucanotransferase domain-containing protein n=1 Tax=Candidatus Palauibacter sp. TaxID=3101350 RepID=UPI003B5A380A
MSEPPLRFAFAIHLHQPVGNFDHVFADHLAGVYRPLLDAIHARGAYPITLHVSGPLLDWLEDQAPDFLDHLGAPVSDGRIELLASGRYEPILAALPPRDRLEQVEWMCADLTARFGVEPTGLWLTERVWEPDLAADVARTGIEYTLLDDRHFLACGLERTELDRVYTTESDGHPLRLLPIDEELRYLIPFRPVEEIVDFFGERRRAGRHQLVLGDDGEKFGGWPGTRAWVYGGGWLDAFLDALEDMRGRDELELITTGEATAGPSGGLAYPAAGSYREMEEWTLPRPAALRLGRLTETGQGPFVRGGHWKGFLRKYPESNRMHKAALRLSRLCRQRGDPHEARRAIARAQCNDAYWHGVFGGVYLPHLRQAIWRELAAAERYLREGEDIAYELVDFDFDGHEEIWVHSSRCSVVISPARGGAIEILTVFADAANYVDVLARRLEAYHRDPRDGTATSVSHAPEHPGDASAAGGITSVHDRPSEATVPPSPDPVPLALMQEIALVGARDAESSDPAVVADWRLHAFRLAAPPEVEPRRIRLRLASEPGPARLEKTLDIHDDGRIEANLDWSGSGVPAGAVLACRLPLAHPACVEAMPAAAESTERIVTLARSERGFEWIDQGEILELAWPASAGGAHVRLTPGGGSGSVGNRR